MKKSKKLRVRRVVRRRSSPATAHSAEALSEPANELPPPAVWTGVNLFLSGCQENDPDALKRGIATTYGGYRFARLDGTMPGVADYRVFLRDTWERLIGEQPPKEVNLELLKTALTYELQYRGFRKQRVLHLLSPNFKSNRKDALKLDVDELSENRRSLHIAAAQCATYGDYTMAKKTTEGTKGKGGARSEGKTLHLGVSACWNHLFETNAKAPKGKRMTDEEISAFMLAEYPDRDTAYFDHVQPVRSKFNRGGIPGQKGEAPDTPSTRYDEDGKPQAARARKAKAEPVKVKTKAKAKKKVKVKVKQKS